MCIPRNHALSGIWTFPSDDKIEISDQSRIIRWVYYRLCFEKDERRRLIVRVCCWAISVYEGIPVVIDFDFTNSTREF
jgi:hypothetical protein